MEKEQVKIDIPEGKMPKLTTSDNGVHVEWIDKEKTWMDYVWGFMGKDICKLIPMGSDPSAWPKMFKFGLLQYIADDLNEEKIDWKNGEQKKVELWYDHSSGKISQDWHVHLHCVAAIFTQKASEKAINIIPTEFLKTF